MKMDPGDKAKQNTFQKIMPPPDEGSPYRENVTNIDPMDIVPKASNVDRVAKAVECGYVCVSNPTVEKGVGSGPKETIKPWRPKGRK